MNIQSGGNQMHWGDLHDGMNELNDCKWNISRRDFVFLKTLQVSANTEIWQNTVKLLVNTIRNTHIQSSFVNLLFYCYPTFPKDFGELADLNALEDM